MTSFDQQENNIYFGALIVNPEIWLSDSKGGGHL